MFDSYYLPVHLAINKGHTDIAKKLINAGCKINELIYVRTERIFIWLSALNYFSFRWERAAAPSICQL